MPTMRTRAFLIGALWVFGLRAGAQDGAAHFAAGRFAEARDAFAAAIEKNAKDAAAHAGLVRARLRLDEWPDALREAKRAVELLPNDASVRASLGSALKRAGKLAAAEAEWRRALALDPNDYDAEVGVAAASQLNGDFPAAIDLARRAAAARADRPEAWLVLSAALNRAQRNAEAADAAAKVVALAPTGIPWDETVDTLPGEIAVYRTLATTTPFALSGGDARIEWKATFEAGYFYLDLSAEGRETFPVVFDTGGSSVLSIDSGIAKKLESAKISDVPVRGASGKSMAWTTLVRRVDLGPLAISNVPTVVLELAQTTRMLPKPFLGVLGVGWLEHHAIVIDFGKKTLALEPSPLDAVVGRPDRAILDEAGGATRLRIPFRLVGDSKIVFEVEVGGDTALALLDTGSPANLCSKSFVTAHTPADALREVPPMGGGVGEGAAPEKWAIGAPQKIALGGREFSIAPAIGMPALDKIISRGSGVQVDFLLGNGFLSNAERVRIDYANQVLTLEGLRK